MIVSCWGTCVTIISKGNEENQCLRSRERSSGTRQTEASRRRKKHNLKRTSGESRERKRDRERDRHKNINTNLHRFPSYDRRNLFCMHCGRLAKREPRVLSSANNAAAVSSRENAASSRNVPQRAPEMCLREQEKCSEFADIVNDICVELKKRAQLT